MLFVLCAGSALHAQQAPTVSQCRVKMHVVSDQEDDYDKYTYDALMAMHTDMETCYIIFSDEEKIALDDSDLIKQMLLCKNIQHQLLLAMMIRYSQFLDRHNQQRQFHHEDVLGLR